MYRFSYMLLFLFFFSWTNYAHGEGTNKEQKVLDMLAAEGTPESLAATPEEMAEIRALLDKAPRMTSGKRQAPVIRPDGDVFPSPRKNRQMVYIRK